MKACWLDILPKPVAFGAVQVGMLRGLLEVGQMCGAPHVHTDDPHWQTSGAHSHIVCASVPVED